MTEHLTTARAISAELQGRLRVGELPSRADCVRYVAHLEALHPVELAFNELVADAAEDERIAHEQRRCAAMVREMLAEIRTSLRVVAFPRRPEAELRERVTDALGGIFGGRT